MPKVKPKVQLIQYYDDSEAVVALAARNCYSGKPTEILIDQVARNDESEFVQGVMERGHMSVAEHASFTFIIEGVSRALLAQLTRHRIASFSVQSQRYVSMNKSRGFDFVVPPSIEALGLGAVDEYERQMDQMLKWYCEWQVRLGGKGESANQDARFILPNAAATRIVMTMNARELLHFFELRCCNRAQWEIRQVADQMLEHCKAVAPALFTNAGCACMCGQKCPEGERSCGHPRTKSQKKPTV